ncbi:MAG TPA: polymer-forming cytoskeletal protein [Aliidongia sp.]|uniref:bactofilin family protein n=1 Tax=Aliidongia sp. TaxID=1914230 RepID=UPI002DDD8CFE|nr:polymer-forming cytoskeletal protein [Aliidongia sp.]HEV2674614.1 polymer-forming cytoskeletal protein [Aliidongia sp.]
MVRRGGGLSILAADFQITGSLRSDGEIHIDGIVNGDVAASAIMVGQSGTVIGDLTADRITIAGTVHGTVSASNVSLMRTARVYADVRCHAFDRAPGAVFELPGESVEATPEPTEIS